MAKGGAVSFRDVDFAYHADAETLSAVTLEIPAGQKVALIVFPIGGYDAWGEPYEIYWNGVLSGREGKMPPGAEWRFRRR